MTIYIQKNRVARIYTYHVHPFQRLILHKVYAHGSFTIYCKKYFLAVGILDYGSSRQRVDRLVSFTFIFLNFTARPKHVYPSQKG